MFLLRLAYMSMKKLESYQGTTHNVGAKCGSKKLNVEENYAERLNAAPLPRYKSYILVMFKGVTGYGEEYNQGLHIFFGYKISTAVIPAPQDN